MKKLTKKSLKAKADKAFSLWIRKYYGRCMLQGLDTITCTPQLQCMHIETRGCLTLRYNPLNALAGCSGHHVYYTYHEGKFKDLIKKHFPKHWKYVEKHKEERTNMTIEDYQELINLYSKEGYGKNTKAVS